VEHILVAAGVATIVSVFCPNEGQSTNNLAIELPTDPTLGGSYLCLRLASLRLPYENANSLARCTAFTTALIKVTRSLPSSSSMMPSIVHPAGVVTASFNSAG